MSFKRVSDIFIKKKKKIIERAALGPTNINKKFNLKFCHTSSAEIMNISRLTKNSLSQKNRNIILIHPLEYNLSI